MWALSEEGVIVPLRSQQKDAGRALTHRVQGGCLYAGFIRSPTNDLA